MLVARLFELQIVQGENLAKEFDLKVVREVESEGQRGNIYDRFGYPLAENVMAYDVLLNDSYEVEDKNEMIHQLIQIIEGNGDKMIHEFPIIYDNGLKFKGTVKQSQNFIKNVFNKRYTSQLSEEQLNMSAIEVYQYMRDDLFEIDYMRYNTFEILDILNVRYAQYIKRFAKYKPETIATNISVMSLAEIEENKDMFPGVNIVESPYRIYNDAPYFAHIIGYTRDISADKLDLMEPLGYDSDDQVGFVGIEKELEPYLRGYDGNQKVEVNSVGKTMLVLEENSPIMGNDVYLTIDRDLQIETYNILEQQMADIIVSKMYMSYPKVDDERYILLKDVFDSIFRYNLIDVRAIEYNQDELSQSIFTDMKAFQASIVEQVRAELSTDVIADHFNDTRIFYYYILNDLVSDGYLDTYFYRSDYYDLFLDGNITFYQLMQAMFEKQLFIYPLEEGDVVYAVLDEVLDNRDRVVSRSTDYVPDPTLVKHLRKGILEDVLNQDDIDLYFYLRLIDQEAYNYGDLCRLIINMGLVSGEDEQLEELSNGRLRPLDFMKEKIGNIEITPQQLALDPSSGSVVISDVDTGEILALVSYPTYDNSRLVNEFDSSYYLEQQLDITGPMWPSATKTTSVPGSTLKMLVGLAALDVGVIGENDHINSKGIFTKIFPPAKCWIYDKNFGTHGHTDVAGAIEESCNYFFYEMGYRLGITEDGKYSSSQGIDVLNDYISLVGLDSKTGLEIEEKESSLPTLDPVRAAIGQETNDYTPVQLARYMNAIADNGVVRELNLVDMVKSKTGDVLIDFTPEVLNENTFEQAHIDIIKQGMLDVTSGSSGTARSYFYDIDLDIAGKTGTAEIKTYDYRSIDPVKSVIKRANHSIFTGFAPYDDPEVSIVSVIRFGYSSKYAALNSKEVLRNYFDLERTIDDVSYDHQLE